MLAGAGYQWDSSAPGELVPYVDDRSGFEFSYPDYWVLETDVGKMLEIQDGSIDLINQDLMTQAERDSYKVLAHVNGSPRYVSNIAVLVHPHRPAGGDAYATSEDALQTVVNDFESERASGTFFLEETYLGESHTYVYRRRVPVEIWADEIRITYYLTASRSRAYMLVETALSSVLTDELKDNLNQVIQTFRVAGNESGAIDPALGWGEYKPDEGQAVGDTESSVGDVDIREEFDDNRMGWPSGDDSKIQGGMYVLDSMTGYPFTVTNTGLGPIGFDFSLEGNVTFLGGDETAGYGLVYGYRDADNYFAFLVTRGGQFLAIEEKAGQVVQLVPWTVSELLNGDTHTLMVQGDYSTIRDDGLEHRYEIAFYIDGQVVASTRIDRVLEVSGWYGVFVSKELNVGFDWIESRNYLQGGVMSLERYE